MFASFKLGKTSYLSGNVYRQPSSDLNRFLACLEDMLCTISRDFHVSNVNLMGDWSLNLLKITVSNKCAEFYAHMVSYGFNPAVLKPTWVTATSQTLIDSIFCNSISRVARSGIVTNMISDHFPIFLSKRLSQSNESEPMSYTVRLRNNECHIEFSSMVWSTDSNSICDSIDVEEVYEAFSARLTEFYESSFPLIHRVTRPIDLH